ncbi:hypothetical protein AB6O49_17590 [Streptomyces sp. SBR177]
MLTALVAAAAGVGGTLLYQRLDAPDTSGVDAQAGALAESLRGDLNAGFHSGGQPYGGQFTQGTLALQAEAHGGVLLSARTERSREKGPVHTLDVMLGLVPPSGDEVVKGGYPVRCYRYTFAFGPHSVTRADLPCPNARTDGKPGSPVAELGALLSHRASGPFARRPLSTQGHPHTPQGAVDFLRKQHLVTPEDRVTAVSGTPAPAGVYAVALRINTTCHYLRMDPSPTSRDLHPLWPAPAHSPCTAPEAAKASLLYGIDPAKAG